MHDNLDQLPRSILLKLADHIWKCSRSSRNRMNHGTRACPQRYSSFNPASLKEALCDSCTELHGMHLHVAGGRVARMHLVTWDEIAPYVMKNCEHMLIEARDAIDAQKGRLVRPARLMDRQWFCRALPDVIDQELIIDVVYFLRSGDQPGRSVGAPLPVERLAERFGLDMDECRHRLTRSMAALAVAKPAFVRDNIDSPLSELLATVDASEWEYRDVVDTVEGQLCGASGW